MYNSYQILGFSYQFYEYLCSTFNKTITFALNNKILQNEY